jgi:membrane associated rhomboid family serine protease/Zn-finger nucleic acid-binding protein
MLGQFFMVALTNQGIYMASLYCSHCHHHLLEPIHYEDIEIDACMHCGGLWFDSNELDQVVHAYDPNYHHKEPIVKTLGQRIGTSSKKCPHCKELLITHQFEPRSDLKIDICESCHGIWLDKGELDQAKISHEIHEAEEIIKKETTWADWVFQFFLQLPVEFNIKPRKFPLITVILIVLNVLLILPIINPQLIPNICFQWGLIPQEIWSFGWFVTLLTHQFLHGGWGHLIGNMYFLYILGDNVEDAMGRIMFPLFYLFCGLVAGMTHVLYELNLGGLSNIPLVGASGAISGVMAAYIYFFRKAKLTFMFFVFQYKLSPIWYFGIWIAMNVLFLIIGIPNVSWAAHLGGFIAGLVFSYFFYEGILKANPLIRYLNKGST